MHALLLHPPLIQTSQTRGGGIVQRYFSCVCFFLSLPLPFLLCWFASLAGSHSWGLAAAGARAFVLESLYHSRTWSAAIYPFSCEVRALFVSLPIILPASRCAVLLPCVRGIPH